MYVPRSGLGVSAGGHPPTVYDSTMAIAHRDGESVWTSQSSRILL